MTSREGISQEKREFINLERYAAELLFPAGIVLLLILLIWGSTGCLPGGDKTFLAGDGSAQFVPFIKMFLRHLFTGQGLGYSFDIGMGMPTGALYAFYSYSPFNLLFCVINDIDTAAFCVMTFKLMVAAACFSLLISRTVHLPAGITAALAAAYALCGFTVNYSYVLIFLDVMYLLPLVMLALHCFVKEGKGWPLCLSYAATFAMQFYVGYMIGVFSLVLFVSLAGYCYGGDKRKWKKALAGFALYGTVAVLLSAPVTLPAAIELFGHLGSDSTVFKGLHLDLWDFLGAFYPGHSQDAHNSVPMVYAGLPALLLAGRFYTGKDTDKRRRIFMFLPLLFLLLCCFWGPAYLWIHAFDAPDGYAFRFSWEISFWLLYVSAWELENLSQKTKTEKGWIFALFWGMLFWGMLFWGIYAIQHILDIEEQWTLSIRRGAISMAFLLAYGLLLSLGLTKKSFQVVSVVLCLELYVNGNMILSEKTGDLTRDGGYYALWQEQAESALAYIEAEEQSDPWPFYRVRNLNCFTDNISMLYGYHGLGYFSSIENEKVRNVLLSLGYATSVRLVEDYGATALTQMLFAQKYSLECGFWRGAQREYYSIQKNPYTLPLGYMVSEELLNCSLSSTNPFENLNRLASAMTGKGETPYKGYGGAYTIETDGMQISWEEGVFHMERTAEADKEGKATFLFPNEAQGTLYAYVARQGISSRTKEQAPLVYSSWDIGGMMELSRLFMPHIIHLGHNGKGGDELFFQILPQGVQGADYENVYLGEQEDAAIEEIYNELLPGGWQLTAASGNELQGDIDVPADKTLLFTSVPYDTGWEAYVDGQKEEIIPVIDQAFIAIRVPEGIHNVRLVYHNRMFLYGGLAALAGFAVLVLSTVIEIKQREDADEATTD